MNKGKKIIKNLFVCLFTMLTFTLCASAANITLNGINVVQNSKDSYNVILKLPMGAKVTKKVISPNSLSVTINSTIPSDNLDINYDNAQNLNNVVVQKKNSENTVIFLEGKNIANSAVYINDTSIGTLSPINSETMFFGVNKKLIAFSLLILFVWFLLSCLTKNHRKRIRQETIKKVNNLITTRTTPSISYKTQNYNNGVQIPKDFVINRYLERERMKKAG